MFTLPEGRMKRTILLLLVLSGMIVPCHAVKRVAAAQLEQLVTSLQGKPDSDLAYQIGDLELTERLSAERIARLSQALPGEKSRQALTAIAAASQFQAPPAEEIPATPAPDLAAQRRIMGLVANYVTKTIPQLPNLLATRATTYFEDTPLVQKSDGFIPYEPLHQVGTSSVPVLYRDGREVEDNTTKVKATPAQGLASRGEFGPILATTLLDAAQSKLAWSHWEQGSDGRRAVFGYDVPQEKSHYEVNYCCVANPGATIAANVVPFREITGYRGEMAVDPATGIILRDGADQRFTNGRILDRPARHLPHRARRRHPACEGHRTNARSSPAPGNLPEGSPRRYSLRPAIARQARRRIGSRDRCRCEFGTHGSVTLPAQGLVPAS
jgi:hypothetical protein